MFVCSNKKMHQAYKNAMYLYVLIRVSEANFDHIQRLAEDHRRQNDRTR